jgi:hypothetical protein
VVRGGCSTTACGWLARGTRTDARTAPHLTQSWALPAACALQGDLLLLRALQQLGVQPPWRLGSVIRRVRNVGGGHHA